ncbi:SusC/RagA family TonB-linked outer membrane protein [Elizabethkingia argentiflava]|uniref:SusC/RagA family TonB-linked outer membrane protein n=1 Tax=Elizabethkingia argenteiflava TaxID=2681556 RepID=A0A845PUP9_9FLAO|nr:SusC/RagA family TonB-linked outer membrane protein [Elizabethkingia argenteiflava]NAW51939.1 SusC/RagA family TonB-linked outer membrane protein [Elizabethkingia argenteiflava]
MKKLINSVLAVVLSSSFVLVSAQKKKKDSTKTTDIEEVVVTGALGIKKKADAVVSAQQVISSKELTLAAPPDAIQGLQAKVSGLQITQTNSSVNPTSRIVLRGVKSITGNNQALIVIDNVISSAAILQQLPPESIENINVIKGLQGAALYGQQGVNGVIVVTTKKGSKSERIQFTLTNSTEMTEAYKLPLYQKKYGKGAVDDSWTKESLDGTYYVPWENTSWGPAFSNPKIGGKMMPSGLPQLNNQFIYEKYAPLDNMYGRIFNKGLLFQNGLSMNVGGYDSYAFLSVNRQDNSFVIPGDEMKRNSFIFKAGKTFGQFHIDGNIQYINQSISQTDPDEELWYNFMQNPTSSNVKLFRNSGRDAYTTSYATNPYWSIKHARNNSNSDYLSGIISIKYDFNKNINVTYTGNLAIKSINSNIHNDGDVVSRIYRVPQVPFLNGKTGLDAGLSDIESKFYDKNERTRNYYGDLMVNFNYDLNEDWNLKFNVGNNIQDNRYNVIQVGGVGLDIPGWYHINNVLKPDPWANLNNYQTNSRIVAGFVNADLAYKNYLFINATGRLEQSSVLAITPKITNKYRNKSYLYYSGGASFIPTKAFEGIRSETLNYMKVSASYTRVGNTSAIDPYQIYATGNIPTGYPFNGLPSYISDIDKTDPDIKPEFISTYEANLNLGLFKDRLTLDASLYQSDTDDLITKATTSSASGLRSLKGNFGKMRMRGFDIDLGGTPIKTKNFQWNLKASYAMSRSKILELGEGLNQISLLSTNLGGIGIYAVKNQDFAMIQGGGIFQRDPQGRIVVNEKGVPQFTGRLGQLGKTTPDFTMNFTTSIKYKGLTLSGIAEWRKGGKFIVPIRSTLAFAGNTEDSADFDRSKGYIVPNSVQYVDGKYVPNTTPYLGQANYQGANSYFGNFLGTASEYYVIDATFFKIREIALAYDIPRSVFSNTFIKSITIGAYARNPFIKYSRENRNFADPETSGTTTSKTSNVGNATGYANMNQYPTIRSFGFNIKATF